MSCKISVSGWQGEDRTVVIEKISKIFRMTPEKATAIMKKLDTGIPWQFDRIVSDQQGKDAKALLVSLGFRVALVPGNANSKGMGLGVNPYTEQEDFEEEEEPQKIGLLASLKDKFTKKAE